ncbi:MAG: hypothetical protein M3280_02930 [Actinomycetota bacterium]|nr:hypothetical protein [Actinomycetota bacterium]
MNSRNQDLAAAGNYNGFRLFNISDPENPVEVANFRCRGPQNDVSFYQAQNRLLLIQSIDRPQTHSGEEAPNACALSADTPVSSTAEGPRFSPGFEGLRVFDVTRPKTPVLIAAVPTACGSHTHTTIPDKDDQRAIIYVSSYPIGASQTPTGADFGGPRCVQPHARISIVEIPDKEPEAARVLKEQLLDADTKPFRGTTGSGGTGAVGCHDITVLTEASQSPESNPRPRRETAAAACLEEGQLWDISDPANPTTTGPSHSHIYNPAITPANPVAGGLFHTASFTWDGEVILFTDEWQGGGGHGCDGPEDTRGNVWFYKAVPPGTPNVPLYGRYMMPRPQPANEICTLHNGNVIPTNDGYFGVSSSYEGGTSVFDFTGVEENPEIPSPEHGQPFTTTPPLVAREVAWADMQSADGRTRDDTWSSYWFNDYIWVNGGLDRAAGGSGTPTQRGFDVFKILLPRGKDLGDVTGPNDRYTQQYRARKHHHMNPQTQEVFQGTGWGQGDQSG